jgi:hypothetical protein
VEAAQQETMQQPADRANKMQMRGKQEAEALVDKRWRHDERANVDNARLAGSEQQQQE